MLYVVAERDCCGNIFNISRIECNFFITFELRAQSTMQQCRADKYLETQKLEFGIFTNWLIRIFHCHLTLTGQVLYIHTCLAMRCTIWYHLYNLKLSYIYIYICVCVCVCIRVSDIADYLHNFCCVSLQAYYASGFKFLDSIKVSLPRFFN